MTCSLSSPGRASKTPSVTIISLSPSHNFCERRTGSACPKAPAGTWPAGTMMDIYEWDTGKYMGKIPQAAQTYNVIGNMNEYQLAIGETTYGGRKELESQPGAIIDYGSLIYITLQRAKNAREAIVVMTDLVERYGYASSGESFSISDPDEVWILEMIGKGEGEKGAVWVARMVPDGYVCAHANQARITTFPLEGKTSISSDQMKKIYDKEITTVYAKDVISFAKQKSPGREKCRFQFFRYLCSGRFQWCPCL